MASSVARREDEQRTQGTPPKGLGVDGLADGAQQLERRARRRRDGVVAGAHERADRRRRRVEVRHLVLVDDAPEAARVGPRRHALEHNLRRAVQQRPVGDVGVARDPAAVLRGRVPRRWRWGREEASRKPRRVEWQVQRPRARQEGRRAANGRAKDAASSPQYRTRRRPRASARRRPSGTSGPRRPCSRPSRGRCPWARPYLREGVPRRRRRGRDGASLKPRRDEGTADGTVGPKAADRDKVKREGRRKSTAGRVEDEERVLGGHPLDVAVVSRRDDVVPPRLVGGEFGLRVRGVVEAPQDHRAALDRRALVPRLRSRGSASMASGGVLSPRTRRRGRVPREREPQGASRVARTRAKDTRRSCRGDGVKDKKQKKDAASEPTRARPWRCPTGK